MIPAAISLLTLVLALAQLEVAPQDALVSLLNGKLYAERKAVNWMVEVRLERNDSSLVATAYTKGTNEFQFRGIVIPWNQDCYLVIKEPGYQEIRHLLKFDDFAEDLRYRGVFTYTGLLAIYLEPLPSATGADEAPIAGAKAIDVKQLATQIPEEAKREYDQAVKESSAGDSEAALEHLEKAVELVPNYYDALNKLGVEYLRAGRYREAEARLKSAIAINPNDPLPLTNLGTLYFQEGEKLASSAVGDGNAGPETGAAFYRKAVEVLEEALHLDPLAPRASFYLGTALYRVGDYERAESLLLQGLSQESGMQEARLTLLNIYIRQRRYDDALVQISAYLEANPDAAQREHLQKLKTQIENAR